MGWQRHPGTELAIVRSGAVTLVREGALHARPVRPRRQALFVGDAVPHRLTNDGSAPAELLVTELLTPGEPREHPGRRPPARPADGRPPTATCRSWRGGRRHRPALVESWRRRRARRARHRRRRRWARRRSPARTGGPGRCVATSSGSTPATGDEFEHDVDGGRGAVLLILSALVLFWVVLIRLDAVAGAHPLVHVLLAAVRSCCSSRSAGCCAARGRSSPRPPAATTCRPSTGRGWSAGGAGRRRRCGCWSAACAPAPPRATPTARSTRELRRVRCLSSRRSRPSPTTCARTPSTGPSRGWTSPA